MVVISMSIGCVPPDISLNRLSGSVPTQPPMPPVCAKPTDSRCTKVVPATMPVESTTHCDCCASTLPSRMFFAVMVATPPPL